MRAYLSKRHVAGPRQSPEGSGTGLQLPTVVSTSTRPTGTGSVNSAAVPLATVGLSVGQYVRSWVEMRVNAGGYPSKWLCGSDFDGTGISYTGPIGGGAVPPSPYVAPNYPTVPLVFAGPVVQIPASATPLTESYGLERVGYPGVTNWAMRYGGLEIVSGYNTPSI